ncbi:MAG: RecX family transcriptional regulator [Dehalococcoidia bacterium]|nr:RecX family transcriptional regulator [Dehalococcoidia bacterium]
MTGQTFEDLRALIGRRESSPDAPDDSVPARPRAPLDAAGRAALQQALRLLSVRGYATAELRRRLLRRHEADAVDGALRSLEGTSFLDDAAWAASYVGGMRGRERSSAILRRDMAARGVDGAVAASALETHDDEVAALAVARRRAGSLRTVPAEVRARRLRDYLLRRGFSAGLAQRATAAALSEAFGTDD